MRLRLNSNLHRESKTLLHLLLMAPGRGGSCSTGSPPPPSQPPPPSPPHTRSAVPSALLLVAAFVDRPITTKFVVQVQYILDHIAKWKSSCFAKNIKDIQQNWGFTKRVCSTHSLWCLSLSGGLLWHQQLSLLLSLWQIVWRLCKKKKLIQDTFWLLVFTSVQSSTQNIIGISVLL